MAFTVTTSYQFPMWTQPNPAFSDGAHFRFKPLQTSHLTSNLICQHPISVLSCSHAAGLILQYGLDMGHVTYNAANHRACCVAQTQGTGEWTNEYSTVNCGSLPFCYLVIPHLHCRCTHINCKIHQSWNTNLHSRHLGTWRRKGLIFMVTKVDNRACEEGKLESVCEKTLIAFTASLICV